MMGNEMYDVIVLGGGGGGVPAAIRASQMGGKVALIEMNELGGFCMNRGCIPFSNMMAAARFLGDPTHIKAKGLKSPDIMTDYGALIKHQDEFISYMRQGVSSTLRKKNVDVIRGKGTIKGKGIIEVDGKEISFNKLILATGNRWQKPDIPGAELEEVVNTDYVLNSHTLPKRVVLFGESPWLLEVAQFLSRFGSRVVFITREKRLLFRESKTISNRLKKVLKEEGIEIKRLTSIKKVSKKEEGLFVELSTKEGCQEINADILVTLDRVADLKGFGLKNVGIDEDSAHLNVNEKTETAAENVYAIGDITAPPGQRYSHRAIEMGIVAGENAMGRETSFDPNGITRVLFTHPEVACIGLTQKEAKQRGFEVMVGTAPLAMNPLGMILSERDGIIEVVAEGSYGEILGVHMIGAGASEIIGQALVAIKSEATVDTLASIPFPHPTLSESLAEAAKDAMGKAIFLP